MYECVNSPITEFKQKNQIDITLPSGPLQMTPQVFAKAREDGGDGAWEFTRVGVRKATTSADCKWRNLKHDI